MTTRRYDASSRRASALRRRRGVVATAARLFSERGWSGTTIAAVADAGGVSVEFVTKSFGGKAQLLQAALSQVGFDGKADVLEAFERLELEAEPGPDARLDLIVEFVCSTMERLGPLVPVLVAGAEQNAVLRQTMLAAREAHARTSGMTVRLLAGDAAPVDAADEVYVLTRAETYLAFVRQRGWSRERYAEWLRRALRHALAPH